MVCSLYALLVGINEYPSKDDCLEGCVNDMESWANYLSNYAHKTELDYKPLILRNGEATRQAIIDGFTKHLAQAKQNDKVVFFFGGHGSEEAGREEFNQTLNEINQTLVCADSRESGGWDLVDKELSNLISIVAESNPHITVILDCCHSGSGTREVGFRKRQIGKHRDGQQRPISSYFSGASEPITGKSTDSKENSSVYHDFVQLEPGNHILMSACQAAQTAKERIADEGIEPRGVFSAGLQEILAQADREMTYAELLTQIQHKIEQDKIQEQVPQLEVIAGDGADRHCMFLTRDNQTGSDSLLNVRFEKDKNTEISDWVIQRGSIHGWPEGSPEPDIELEIFAFDSTPQEIQQGLSPLVTAQVKEVGSVSSKLSLNSHALDPARLYKALITKDALPQITLLLEGMQPGIEVLKSQLEKLDGYSVNAHIVNERTDAMVVLKACERHYDVYRGPILGAPMRASIARFPYQDALGKSTVEDPLVRISRWQQLMTLENPKIGRIPRQGVTLKLLHNGKVSQGNDVRLDYISVNGQWQALPARLQLSNNTNERLYCAMFDLSSEFSINPDFLTSGGDWISPSLHFNTREIRYEMPQEFLEQGERIYHCLYKVIVSTKPFNPFIWQQGYLSQSDEALPAKVSERRGMSTTSDDDWMTVTLLVREVWPDQDPNVVDMVPGTLVSQPSEQKTFESHIDHEVGPSELWSMDEHELLQKLGRLDRQSSIVLDKSIARQANVLARSPKVTERPIAQRKEIEISPGVDRGMLQDWLAAGQETFTRISPDVYELLCSPIGEDNSELARTLTKLMGDSTEDAATKLISLLGPALIAQFSLPQTAAMLIATLLIKKTASETSDFICGKWKAGLKLDV